jgi:hypothetical protein
VSGWALRAGPIAAPVEGEAVGELDERAARVPAREGRDVAEAAGPGRERRADLRLERAVAAEEGRRLRDLASVVEGGCTTKRHRLGIGPNAEVEHERRPPRFPLRVRRRRAGGERQADGQARRGDRDEGRDEVAAHRSERTAGPFESLASSRYPL